MIVVFALAVVDNIACNYLKYRNNKAKPNNGDHDDEG